MTPRAAGPVTWDMNSVTVDANYEIIHVAYDVGVLLVLPIQTFKIRQAYENLLVY